MAKHINPPEADLDADFLGWQKTVSGKAFPLFNVLVADHPLYHSTVTEATLRRLHLRLPRTIPSSPDKRQSPWHNKGMKLNYAVTAKEAIEMGGLDYRVVKVPLGLKRALKQDDYATVRTDTDEILGYVSRSYEPIQNIDAFTFFDVLVAREAAIYESAGIIGKGEHVWILAKLPGCIKIRDDIVNKYLLLINSHDGISQVRVKLTPIRAVCNNTLTAALQGAGEVQVNNTSDVVGNLEKAITIVGWSNFLYEKLNIMFNDMAAKKNTPIQLHEYLQALFPDNDEAENIAGTEKIRNRVFQLQDSGRGANLSRGTVWGAFNSVAEYTDHLMSSEDSATRLNSIWFGRGEHLKLQAFHLAKQMMQA